MNVTEIDHCEPDPCVNGKCENTREESRGYHCTCSAGWQGVNCDESKMFLPLKYVFNVIEEYALTHIFSMYNIF